MTEWREVEGFPGYDVSDDGQVRSWRKKGPGKALSARPKGLKMCPDRDGYSRVTLRDAAGGKTRTVHRLVLSAFVGQCPDGMECCHSDGNRTNNTVANLRWDTAAANADDRCAHGNTAMGERQGSAKLTWPAVRAIRSSSDTQRAMAKRYGVCQAVISCVVLRQSWKHDPLEQLVSQ